MGGGFGSPHTSCQGVRFRFGRRGEDSPKLLEWRYQGSPDLVGLDVMLQETHAGAVKHGFQDIAHLCGTVPGALDDI